MASLNDIFSCICKTCYCKPNDILANYALNQSFVNSILSVIFSAALALATCIVSAI